MKEIFVKKYWEENGTWFYLHFEGEKAIRQIEISSEGKKRLSLNRPTDEDSMLYDQSLKGLGLSECDFISKEEFENEWRYDED
jgi:hypothetical protein